MILGTWKAWVRTRLLAACLLVWAASCQSAPPIESGIRGPYAAVNPTRILAMTPMVVALPFERESVIDPVILETVPVADELESRILESFRDQPAVNGVSFKAVRKALTDRDSNAYSDLLKTLDKTILTMRQPRKLAREELSQSCLSPASFAGFYVHCLANQKRWRQGLNELSAAAFNADAALFFFVTELRGEVIEGKRQARARLEALLLDTNNAEVIWSGSSETGLPQKEGSSTPESPKARWVKALSWLVSESLWAGFPGRKPPPPPLDDKTPQVSQR